MTGCALDLLNPTRRALLLGIMRRGRAVAEDLAAETFISPGAARHHLRSLEMQGYLTHETDRVAGPLEGRPAHLYQLTPLGKSLFPNGSSALLAGLLKSIEGGDSAVRAGLLDTTATAVLHMLPHVSACATLAEKVRALGRGLDTVGAMTEVTEPANGRVRFMLGNCPVETTATRQPFACDLELMVIQRAVAPAGVRVIERRTCGEGMCRYEIAPAPGG